MKHEPLVSVIIPAFNASETIISCLNSVILQTYSNIEIIIIDDGSTDNTLDIVKEYKEIENITNLQIVSQINSGPSAARNLGIKMATGEFIAFLDSDDTWTLNKIEKQIQVFQSKKNAILVGTLTKYITSKKLIEQISFKKLLRKNYFSTPTVICKSDVLKEFQFNHKQKYSEDYRLWLQIAEKYHCFILNEALVNLYSKRTYGEKGLSANLWAMEKGELSNYYFFFKKGSISILYFIFIVSFSFIKFIKRYIISKYYIINIINK